MKTKHLFFGLLAGIALAGCSSDESITDSGNAIISDGTTRYMAVNILAASDVNGTRSSFETTSGYEPGTDTENAVSNVRFYFFNDDGTAAKVKKLENEDKYVNYLDLQNPSSTTGTTTNVEKKLAATLIIETPKGDRIPTKMLTLVNLKDTELAALNGIDKTNGGNPSLDQIRDYLSADDTHPQVGDYAKFANEDKRFVMATSVYASAKERISTTKIESKYLKTAEKSEDAKTSAEEDPVLVYVERNVGKIRMHLSSAFEKQDDNTYRAKVYSSSESNSDQLTITKGEGNNTTEVPVYFQVTGWTLAHETENTYLSKHLIPTWEFNTGWSSITAWNDPSNFRSYWALNIRNGSNSGDLSGDKGGVYYSTVTKGFDNDDTTNPNYVYTNENAATLEDGAQRANPTEVIVAGKLVDADGNAIEKATFRGKEMYGKSALITAMLPYAYLYVKSDSVVDETNQKVTSYTYTHISESTPLALMELTENSTDVYKVNLVLNNTYPDYTQTGEVSSITGHKDPYLYKINNNGEYEAVKDAAEVKTILANAGTGQIYTGGATYYWFKVKHLSLQDKGEYGVVRNHVYDFTLNKVIGMGTPVYNPESETVIIDPVSPVDENTYIAAQINILSWRLVSSYVTLE